MCIPINAIAAIVFFGSAITPRCNNRQNNNFIVTLYDEN